jgi:hypothetical protein
VAIAQEPSVDPTQPTRRERMPHALPHGMSLEGLGLRRTLGTRGAFGAPGASWVTRDVVMGILSTPAHLEAAPGTVHEDPEVSYGIPAFLRTPGRGRYDADLILRKGRELTFEIAVDPGTGWQYETVRVLWPGGVSLAAEVVEGRTTARGEVPFGGIIRLVVRLAEDGPGDPPDEVLVRSRDGLLRLRVRTRA